jgi:mono/diheme cytochrome c family protein
MADVVRGQIAYPEPPMPANLYRGKDADDVATYIAKCSGNENCGVTAAGAQQQTPTTQGSGAAGAPKGAPKPDGEQVFTSAGCGGCHTLKAAGASGNVGPNLDTLKPSQQVAAKQVANGGGGMPPFKGRLTDAEIQAVAAYVADNAGK